MNQLELIEKAAIKLCPIGIKLIQEEHDVASSRGGRNTVYHHCDIYQGRPSYASCLMVMDQAFEGVNRELRPQCHEAIERGTCPAMALRKEELKAGRALFYVDYVELTARRQAQWAIDRENSPVQFRKNRTQAFKPTVFSKDDLQDIKETKQTAPKVGDKPLTDDDYNTNIMEQVAKKVLNDHIDNRSEG